MRTQSKPPWAALVMIGLTAIIAQIVSMRELVVVFSGNEISLGLILASWLLWTAFGSGVLGRFAVGARNSIALVAALQGLLGIAFPAIILAARASKIVFRPTPGETLGPGAVLVTSLVVLALFCPISGWLFATASKAYAESTGAREEGATGFVYLLEAAGSGVGGLLASLVLLRYFGSIEIALLLSLANFASAIILSTRGSRSRYPALGALLAGFVLFVFPIVDTFLGQVSLGWLWRGYQVVATRDSVFGNLAVLQTAGTKSLAENGTISFSVPDPAAAEEAVHFALLQHPAPRRLLLIGGGANGSILQALQHASLQQIDYVELNPTILHLAREYFPDQWKPIESDPRIQVHSVDGRLFLKIAPQIFDVIIVNLGDPQTAQINRFYTAEFFHEAAEKLAPDGVFSFQVRATEDYISPQLADFLRCLRQTLHEVFADVTFIPGETAHFFAAKKAGVLARGPQDLVRRLATRGLHTQYVREYYIPFRMMPDRMADFDAQTNPRAGTPTNHDFAPIAYFVDVVLWSKKFNQNLRNAFLAAAGLSFRTVALGTVSFLILLFGTLHGLAGSSRRLPLAAAACTAATGFTLIGLQLFILLGFQAIYGFVYHQLAILIAAFMAGMALGCWAALRGRPGVGLGQELRIVLLKLAAIQVAVAVLPLALCGLLTWFGGGGNIMLNIVVPQVVFPLLALLCGSIGGYQFPVASRVYFAGDEQSNSRIGSLYALDLIGACLGAVTLSLYFIPVFGFLKTAILLTCANLVPASLGFVSFLAAPVRRA